MRFTLTSEENGVRLDKVLCARIEGLGRAAVKRLFADGRVRLISESGAARRAVKGDVGAEGLVVEVEVPSGDTAAVADPLAPLTVVLNWTAGVQR